MSHENSDPKRTISRRRQRLEELSIGKVLPSGLTLLGLCCGATAIRFALAGEWKLAVVAILAAMVFDMLDGRAARFFGADSRFGTQLDSLADLVSFGLAPAITLYVWSLNRLGTVGWIVLLVFCACSAIRLARFNVQTARDEGATHFHPYFVGLPTPAAAGIMILPLLLSFEFSNGFARNPILCAGLGAVTSALMVSRVPTPSLKYLRFNRDRWSWIAALTLGLALLAIFAPWTTLVLGLVVYLGTIPVAIRRSHLGGARKTSAPVPTDRRR
ncbi:MAG TPA: CDP-diacylglycerol--serine O-phosphatidyltransferase [Rhizomicrobium sp.]|nr:CDP-diacylglycerol--serine O-phosphatidyltransferase [Rhizomicrobium sp.]